jgi:threonine dehydratase
MTHLSSLPVRPADVEAAALLVAPYIRKTPIMGLESGAFGHSGTITFKLEFLQHAGSFKTRGAFNTLLSLPVPSVGVAAASGGNHGVAVAYAAQRLGHPATIFVPEIASLAKVEAIKRHGANAMVGGARYSDALERCQEFIARSGACSVHAYDTRETIAGQGTLAHEWEKQLAAQNLRPLDTVLVATGGGGLISGIAAYWENNKTRVIGVEPRESCALHAALAAGRPIDVDVNSIAADSLGAKRAGTLVYEIASKAVADVVLVDDKDIVFAQRLLWQDYRMVLEPGGAAALAALISGAFVPQKDEHIGVLLCGANLDLKSL